MVNPPKQGEPSHPLFEKERNEIYESMIKRTAKILPSLQSLEGVTVKSSPGNLKALMDLY
jgi:alanine transaminase